MLLLAIIAGLYVAAAIAFAACAELYARGLLSRGEYGSQAPEAKHQNALAPDP